jgi:hypothetical protein
MASLLKKVFDTMPLAGVEGTFYDVPGNPNEATMGQMARHLAFHRRPPKTTVATRHPSMGFLEKLTGQVPDPVNGRWDLVEVWGYDMRGDPSRVDRVTCRVRDDDFKNYLVLERLEWGYAPIDNPKSFRRGQVLIVFNGKSLVLPLSLEYHLMSFTTFRGINQGGVHWLWPIEARHDRSFVHIFAYDLDRASTAILPLNSPDHPQKSEVDAMLARCDRLNTAKPDDEDKAHRFLFKDDLWDTSHSKAPPIATVPEDVNLSLNAIRILVACSLTPCRERDDYQPGRPAGVGRLYPHVMVVATAPLDRVDAGVRFTRPDKMTLMDGGQCGCHEMVPEIRTLLVTDSNHDAMVVSNAPVVSAPQIYWANLFNYYVPDPISDPNLGDKLIPLVERSKKVARDDLGSVRRDCSDIRMISAGANNDKRVTKFPRQGQFDNIHVAPRMDVKDKIDRVVVFVNRSRTKAVTIPFKSYEDWRMTNVVMAPLCPHDCFHMHWRWADNLNHETATFGWGAKTPHQEVGAPMVPENQDVFMLLLKHNAFSYLAQAHEVQKDKWQPFCHHGAGYALSSKLVVTIARGSAASFDDMRFEVGSGDFRRPVIGDFALFYWRLRYRLKPVEKLDPTGQPFWDAEVEERFSFKDEARALKL